MTLQTLIAEATQADPPPLLRLDAQTRVAVVMALVGLVLVGLLLIGVAMVGGRWLRRVAGERPRRWSAMGCLANHDFPRVGDSHPPRPTRGAATPETTVDRRPTETRVDG